MLDVVRRTALQQARKSRVGAKIVPLSVQDGYSAALVKWN